MDNFNTFYHGFAAHFSVYADDFIDSYNASSEIKTMLRYALIEHQGKYFRPLLVHLVGSHYSLDQKHILALALSIEAIHTYSLIHDDLPSIDNASMRRGVSSCWLHFGEANAILLGDGLQTLAFEILSNISLESRIIVDLVRLFSKNIGFYGMVLGQFMDLNPQKRQSFHFNERYHVQEELVWLKTGSLLNLCIQASLICSNAPSHHFQDWENFARNLGLLFQYRDDYLDHFGNEAMLGKPTHQDLRKKTLLDDSYCLCLDTICNEMQKHLRDYGCLNSLFKGMMGWIMEREA
jgi:geranylgeranyl pyrophosphate synthase